VITLVAEVIAKTQGHFLNQFLGYRYIMGILIIESMIGKDQGYMLAVSPVHAYSTHGKRRVNVNNIKIQFFQQHVHTGINWYSQGKVRIGR
jgi:hypothetical protein